MMDPLAYFKNMTTTTPKRRTKEDYPSGKKKTAESGKEEEPQTRHKEEKEGREPKHDQQVKS